MDDQLPSRVHELQEIARRAVEAHVAPRAADVDARAEWPAHS
jgi:hypothetical protein